MRPRYRAYSSRGTGAAGGGLAAASNLAYGVGGLALAAAAVGAVVAYTSLSNKPRRRAGLSRQQWEAAVTETGAISGFESILNEVSQKGLEPELRSEVWPFLLGVFTPESTFEERRRQHALMAQQHQQLLLQCQALEAALRDCVRARDAGAAAAALVAAGGGGAGAAAAAAPPPLELPAQVVQFAEAHRIIVIDAVRTDFRKHTISAIYSSAAATHSFGGPAAAAAAAGVGGGAALGSADGGGGGGGDAPPVGGTLFGPSPLADPLVLSWVSGWLGGRPGGAWGGGGAGGGAAAAARRLWVSEAAQMVLDSSGHLGDDGRRQAARLIALLSAYAVFDPETGYCQGMSDLATPLLVLFDDDALAFWAFAALMRAFGARGNFAVDESGIFSQLRALAGALGRADRVLAHKLRALGAADCHFAYRMVVVLMRRDLPLAQVMTLWELLWADARKQLLQRRRRAARSAGGAGGARSAGGGGEHANGGRAGGELASGGSYGGSYDGGDGDDDPKAALRRAQAAKEAARTAAAEEEGSGFLADAFSDLFVHFVAAVAISQRRRVLDECAGPDDAMRLFHGLRGVDFWECVARAQVLRAAGASRKGR